MGSNGMEWDELKWAVLTGPTLKTALAGAGAHRYGRRAGVIGHCEEISRDGRASKTALTSKGAHLYGGTARGDRPRRGDMQRRDDMNGNDEV